LPKPDAKGDYPAVEYARASLARKTIKSRRVCDAANASGFDRVAFWEKTHDWHVWLKQPGCDVL
jgi:hypothetical protein